MTKILGNLVKNEIGRWEIEGHEFSSGSCLEIQLDKKWIKGCIEHAQGDYYFYTSSEGIQLSLTTGMKARVTFNI
ncbi:MAG: hypothetical protein COW78_00025 [Bdellovibrio sp. CG22_combo_CG10-13_8_21_14_all_39_27]|nr:MAG: hypothetical protein COW78_00025 [Bdellovibrio sp. CG22_combo_CG10-13_8_21_14_all_39_27]